MTLVEILRAALLRQEGAVDCTTTVYVGYVDPAVLATAIQAAASEYGLILELHGEDK